MTSKSSPINILLKLFSEFEWSWAYVPRWSSEVKILGNLLGHGRFFEAQCGCGLLDCHKIEI